MLVKTIRYKVLSLSLLFSLSCFASHSLEQMTLEEKVGQLLLVHFNGEEANEEAKTLIQEVQVGGIIYYNWANGLHSPQQVSCLSRGLQELAKQKRYPIPLLIAVDQEGGRVTRLREGFTVSPDNGALGKSADPSLAEHSAFVRGQELRAVGINLNLAPVVDVNSNPNNPIIGSRSFGDSAEVVIAFARRALEGYRRAGVLTCLKHFPGHGDVEVDSHADLPVVNKSKEQLDIVELLPFAALAGQADTIMTAHIIVPALDSLNCATLSKNILKILREETGFQGVIVSDSLVMEGLLKNCASVEDAAVKALEAGCDLLILGGKQLVGAHQNLELTVADVQRIHHTIVEAVKSGRIAKDRVDQAVQRILTLKNRYPLFRITSDSTQP
jgi:beta-N-acetylhexosaminidase